MFPLPSNLKKIFHRGLTNSPLWAVEVNLSWQTEVLQLHPDQDPRSLQHLHRADKSNNNGKPINILLQSSKKFWRWKLRDVWDSEEAALLFIRLSCHHTGGAGGCGPENQPISAWHHKGIDFFFSIISIDLDSDRCRPRLWSYAELTSSSNFLIWDPINRWSHKNKSITVRKHFLKKLWIYFKNTIKSIKIL